MEKELLIQTLQQYYTENGRSPTTADCSMSPILKGKGTYARYFGSFTKALEAAGLPLNRKKPAKAWTKETLIESLLQFQKENGRSPKHTDCANSTYLASHTTYAKHFYTFTNAIKAAGLTPSEGNYYATHLSDEELLGTLKRFFQEHNRTPKLTEYKSVDYLKSFTTYYNRFGSVKKAIELAGIDSLNKTISKDAIDENTSDNAILASLKRFYKEYSRIPQQSECESIDYLPSWGTFYYRFGSLRNALILADIPLDQKGSGPELDLLKYIESKYSGPIITNDRKILKGKEIDIYLPELSLGFEFNGIYWHSEDKIDSKYHLNKTLEAESKGIKLIHIFEHQWFLKPEVVKSRISNLLGNSIRISARKCKVVNLNTTTEFLKTNHIQGAAPASIKLGLEFENEIVAVMTLSKPRYSTKYQWELIRYCCKNYHNVVGGASKLLKHFERTYLPESIVSYADRCWSTGALYQALDFQLSHLSEPNYWYFKNRYEVESRIKYQKHKLKDLLEIFDPALTESENMRVNGYKRFFDCGNLVYIKRLLS